MYQRKKIDNDKDKKEAHIDLLLGKHICSFKMHQLVSFMIPNYVINTDMTINYEKIPPQKKNKIK